MMVFLCSQSIGAEVSNKVIAFINEGATIGR
jgi:hypothetical protein